MKSAWTIVWSNYTPSEQRLDSADLLSLIKNDFPVTLKDDKRSLVKQGQLFGKKVVAKNPRDKNRRKWARFLSIFTLSEAKQNFTSLDKFSSLNIPASKPFAVLEKRQLGCIVESWLLYEYIEGQTSTADDLPEIIRLIDTLHQHDFQHNDPHYENFLKHANGTIHLIDCKGKKRIGSLTDCLDFLLLQNYHPEATTELIQKNADYPINSFGYKLATIYTNYKYLRKRWKQLIRKKKN